MLLWIDENSHSAAIFSSVSKFTVCKSTVKPVLSGHSNRGPKLIFKTDFHLMQVKSIAECILPCLDLHLATVVIKIFILSIFEWPLKTGLTVQG